MDGRKRKSFPQTEGLRKRPRRPTAAELLDSYVTPPLLLIHALAAAEREENIVRNFQTVVERGQASLADLQRAFAQISIDEKLIETLTNECETLSHKLEANQCELEEHRRADEERRRAQGAAVHSREREKQQRRLEERELKEQQRELKEQLDRANLELEAAKDNHLKCKPGEGRGECLMQIAEAAKRVGKLERLVQRR